MKRCYFALSFMALSCLSLSGCVSKPSSTAADQTSQAALEQLELRVNQLERKLSARSPGNAEIDQKVPAGPLQSLTLRLGRTTIVCGCTGLMVSRVICSAVRKAKVSGPVVKPPRTDQSG